MTQLARRPCGACGAVGCASPEHAAWLAAMADIRNALTSLAALVLAAGPMRVAVPFTAEGESLVALGTVTVDAPSRPLMLWLYAAMKLHFMSLTAEVVMLVEPRLQHRVGSDDQPDARPIVLDDEIEARSRSRRYLWPSERAARRRRRHHGRGL